jgi:osmoprotectant transport system permease protein
VIFATLIYVYRGMGNVSAETPRKALNDEKTTEHMSGSGYDLGLIWEFLGKRLDEILDLTVQHIAVVIISVLIATVMGVGAGILVWNRPSGRGFVIAVAGVILTIPSMAMLALMIPSLGLGWVPTVVALSMYSLLPIVRNTIVGLREVSPAVLESAAAMGMTPAKVMFAVQIPIAWPVILTGLRVATQLAVGIAAIAAYVAGPGMGTYIFRGLSMLGAKNALNFALTGTICVILIALILDAFFILINRVTTSRGLRE